MEFVIESNIPKSKPVRARGGRASTYPFGDMKIGQSFKVVFESTEKDEIEKVSRRVRTAILSFKKRDEKNKTFVLSTRTVTGAEEHEGGIPGLRVFRDAPKTVATA
jgi:hypothetical protein